MRTPEGYVKDDIVKFLKKRPSTYFFKPVQMGRGKRTLDILTCMAGRFVAIEVKREGEKPTALQELIMKEITDAGGIAFWCDSFESFMLNMRVHGLYVGL